MNQLTPHRTRLRPLWVSIFAICMGVFEGAIVVYIRALYYPNGFDFPIAPMNTQLIFTELLREAASLLMIVSVAWLSAPTAARRFGQFLYIFGLWDIVYYLFLKAMLGWPATLLTWDVLFLLPILWSGPVISPAFIAFLMMLWGYTLAYPRNNKKVKRTTWYLLIAGAVVIFISFIFDYGKFLLGQATVAEQITWRWFESISYEYYPEAFPWDLWSVGVIIIAATWIAHQYGNNGKKKREQ